MSDICLVCVKKNNLRLGSAGSLKARVTMSHNPSTNVAGLGNLRPKNGVMRGVKAKLLCDSNFKNKENMTHGLYELSEAGEANIRGSLKVRGNIKSRVSGSIEIKPLQTDKFAGSFESLKNIDFKPTEKLYPIADVITELNGSVFIDKSCNTANLYTNLDEGVSVGNYVDFGKNSTIVSDEKTSYIQPSSVYTDGDFRYRFEVSTPTYHAKNSYLFIRASAPISTYSANIPPQYKIHNITLNDPSGNLIIKYKDIILRGDADYSTDYSNFTTYITEPETNKLLLNTWEDSYPLMGEASGYTLNLDFSIQCLDDPFDTGFNKGYEDTCILPSSINVNLPLNPDNSLRISSIELANSGELGIRKDNYLRFYTEVSPIGQRITRSFAPVQVINSDVDVDIYPESYTSWKSSPDSYGNIFYNDSKLGSDILTSKLQDDAPYNYITAVSSSPNIDGGRLTLKFSHQPPTSVASLADGEFSPGFNRSPFKAAQLQRVKPVDNFFVIDDISLKVIAKKAVGSSNYALDIVGYSDDKVINITPKVGAFLQNAESTNPRPNTISTNWLGGRTLYYAGEGSGKPLYIYNDELVYWNGYSWVMENTYAGIMYESTDDVSQPWLVESWTPSDGTTVYDPLPTVSGFKSIDDLGIATNPLSNKSQYFENSSVNSYAGDHYLLSTAPIISGIAFQEYIIPLTIYKDNVELGQPIDYSMSSYFENLYLDIYPIPSGASICTAQLVVTYKPSNGLMMHTLAHANKELARRNLTLYPTSRQKSNDYINSTPSISGFLSDVGNVPAAYKQSENLKSNYSRRWRGVDGNVKFGPYNPNQFDFSFSNPEAETPFLNGYFTFNYDVGNHIISNPLLSESSITGTLVGSYNKITNLGLRFNDNPIFEGATLREFSYVTTDWVRLLPSLDFACSGLIGKISDSFDNALIINGSSSNHINFGDVDFSDGFAIYIRFSPSLSANTCEQFNNGVVLAKWDAGQNLDIMLGYESGYLCGYARNTNGSIVKVTDSIKYDAYSYPLPVLLTYNDNNSGKLKLYTDNDLSSLNTSNLRAESSVFTRSHNNSDLIVGYCSNSDIGFDMIVSEIGLSSYNDGGSNITTTAYDKLLKQTTASSFFSGLRMPYYNSNQQANNRLRLNEYIDDSVEKWHLGAFKICQFSPDFDYFTARIGQDFIVHNLKHSGSGYSTFTNLPLPSNVNASGLAYHTQIENDFLRFNLSDMSDNDDTSRFYSTYPRICKTLPRGYQFADRAIVVDTIVQHETYNNISWEDGNVGPKLIVSLYTKNQDPTDRPSKINWGLVNRAIHYLEPSGCWQKLESKFDFDNLVDISEPWALFDVDRNITEFDHKYYSKDIDDMFLQYDLVYPSGSAFDSKIKIHSANVRLEDAIVQEQNRNTGLNLVASGEQKWLESINLHTRGLDVISDSQNLYTIATSTPIAYDSIPLYVEGGYQQSNINLFVQTIRGSVDSSTEQLFGSLFGSGPGENYYLGPNLYVGGRSSQSNVESLPLRITTDFVSIPKSSGSIYLSTKTNGVIQDKNSLNFFLFASSPLLSVYSTELMPLYLNTQPAGSIVYQYDGLEALNLYIKSYNPLISGINNSIGLYTINYSAFNATLSSQEVISWNSKNTGKNIAVDDNKYAFLDANDEIRGVDLLCYGSCPSGLCQESSIELHEEIWSTPNACSDGGIFRAKNTYTNLETSGFKTDVGYSGHFYGIRKYTNLIPNAPYNVLITGKTGSKNAISLPTEFMEVEYGVNDINDYSGRKLAADKGLSASERQAGDKFGKSVAVRGNLMGIGAPMHKLTYQEGSTTYDLDEAGAVYLYRRGDRPSGYSWPNDNIKSPWLLETKLTLPSGLLKDYSISSTKNSIGNITLPFDITETTWNVGQEGRQFGHSLDIASTAKHKSFEENIREILVVGGPSAKWNRDFDGLETSGVQIGLMIFTDEFTPTISRFPFKITYSYVDILESIKNKDIIFKYFSDPPIRFDVKLIICEANANSTNITSVDFPEPKPDFIVKKRIQRNKGPVNPDRTNAIFSGIKEAFHSAFPYDENKLHNNIPPILGLYVDNSRSLGKLALNPALTQFTNYFKEYSFASGLRDFYGVRDSGAIVEFIPNFGAAENWVVMSQLIIDNVLDTGRLLANNQVRFLTSGVGQEYFNENLGEFNYPPESGGRVYVFEKESGSWNLIQEIKSPNITYSTPDRFGHAVALSDDTEVLAIGSPYINEAFKVYEYKPEEKSRLYDGLYSWLSYKNSATGGLLVKYSQLVGDYITWANKYGVQYANKILYSKLDSTDKFHARQYLNIQEYQSIYTYKYSNIGLVCSNWEFIPQHFAPTSRLGYSVAINEDGTYVACGAPTDSFNQWEDGNVYYKNLGYANPNDTENLNTSLIKPNWRSSVNAGAVRVFESRKYYPHDTVVEFGKFGNLQESMNFPEDSGHFNYLASIFQDKNFRKTEFTDVHIPQEAGLAFIITPEVDALSDEVADNILDWLALGDRNLVLVGNDPVWEKGGIYEQSNDIINKILSRLQSRMRLLPAKNAYEAMVSGCSLAIPSFIPGGATKSYVQPVSTSIYGVGDIRMYLGQNSTYNVTMPCVSKNNLLGTELIDRNESAQEVLNNKCELPLRHLGDLRAQWVSRCRDCGDGWIYYPVNWPFIFRTFQPACCGQPKEGVYRFFAPNQEPVPLMVAADYHTETITIPASPATSGYRAIYRDVPVNTYSYVFSEDKLQLSPAFIWDSGVEDYSNISYNINNSNPEGLFYKPDSFENRQSLLLANAISQETIVPGRQLISDNGYFAVEESLVSKSKIIFIAGVETESSNNLYAGVSDENINFYANLAAKSVDEGSKILQLGSWTGRDSFVSAYSESILKSLFENNLCEVLENSNKLYDDYDICWIANPIGLPSDSELLELKQWLALPHKKLIVTYDNNLSQVLLVKQLSDLLNSKIKPLYLNVDDKYAQSQAGEASIYDPAQLMFNPNHPVSTGFNPFYSIYNYNVKNAFKFTPIKLVSGLTPICYVNKPIYDTKYDTVGYWKMSTGVTKVSFPSIPGSGYKIFISTISETPSENQILNIAVQNVSKSPQGSFTFRQCIKPDCSALSIPNVGFLYTTNFAPTPNIIQTQTVNLKAQEDTSEINFYIYSESDRLNTITNSYLPKTTRLHSISGVLMPIEQVTNTYQGREISGWELIETSPAKEAITFTNTRLSAILNDNTRYCESSCEETLGHKLIEDGPVIVAQEIEHFSEFLAGVARSRITLLADSSLVQGQCMGDEFFRASNESVNFIRSLYPYTNFPDTNGGRQYTTMHKILSPERGSPNKYRAIVNNSGINSRFGDGVATSMPLTSFEDKESRYDPEYVQRPKSNPWSDFAKPEEIERIKNQYIKAFSDAQFSEGGTAMFSGVINGTLYRDAGIGGGIPQIMKDTGYDYLDFDFLPSGYPGDLFGHSIALYKDKLIIGSPFSAFSKDTANDWNYVIDGGATSGIALSHNGGAGSVYIFEHTGRGSGLNGTTTPWEFTQKLRPDSLNVGENSGIAVSTDQFGYDIDIDGDVIVVGAPGHDYENLAINSQSAFLRRNFNSEFDIPSHKVIDLGLSSNRYLYPGSGIVSTNNGAIFTFENKIIDWPTKTQKWIYVEKIVPQGSGDRHENDCFGRSVYIDKTNRSDADYTVLGGANNHIYSTSGTNPLISAGSAYTHDIVLRNPAPAIQSPDSYIDATFFGETTASGEPKLNLRVQNYQYSNKEFSVSGLLYSNDQGEIFIEASGQDPVLKGFIEHRPYIMSVEGQYLFGTPNSGNLSLNITGKINSDQNLDIYTKVDDSAIVYNTIGLYNSAILAFASGVPSGLHLYVHAPAPVTISESGLCLFTASGIGLQAETINLSIRGK